MAGQRPTLTKPVFLLLACLFDGQFSIRIAYAPPRLEPGLALSIGMLGAFAATLWLGWARLDSVFSRKGGTLPLGDLTAPAPDPGSSSELEHRWEATISPLGPASAGRSRSHCDDGAEPHARADRLGSPRWRANQVVCTTSSVITGGLEGRPSILPDGEDAVVLQKHGWGLADVLDHLLANLLAADQGKARARDGAAELVCHGRQINRDWFAYSRKGCCVARVRVDNPVDIGAMAVDVQVAACIGRWLQVALDDLALEADHHHQAGTQDPRIARHWA